MKIYITYSGEEYESQDDIKRLAHINDVYSANDDARQMIRDELKHGDPLKFDRERFLEHLRSTLFVEGVE